jgi:hypothetical protein
MALLQLERNGALLGVHGVVRKGGAVGYQVTISGVKLPWAAAASLSSAIGCPAKSPPSPPRPAYAHHRPRLMGRGCACLCKYPLGAEVPQALLPPATQQQLTKLVTGTTSAPMGCFAVPDYRSSRHSDGTRLCWSSGSAGRRCLRSACLCQTLRNSRFLRG